MRVDVVVILEPGGQRLKDRDGVWPWVHAGIVAFLGFEEGLAYPVAFRAADRVKHGTRLGAAAKSVASAAL